jgi:hypothetical protein
LPEITDTIRKALTANLNSPESQWLQPTVSF